MEARELRVGVEQWNLGGGQAAVLDKSFYFVGIFVMIHISVQGNRCGLH